MRELFSPARVYVGMRQHIFALLLLPALCTPAPALEPKAKRPLEFIHLSTLYHSFEHIAPVVANTGDKPLYLSSFHPQAAAQLVRFNEETGAWEGGAWARQCATVAGVTKPIEVLPGGSFLPQVFWQYSMDDWEHPTAFETADDARRPLRGRYKLALRYAEEPWMLGHTPPRIYTVESAEFTVDP